MPLGKKQIERLAQLARLELSPQERDRLDQDLSRVMDYFEQLQHVQTDGIEPGVSLSAASHRRTDGSATSLSVADVLANAPHEDGGYFLVPRVIDR